MGEPMLTEEQANKVKQLADNVAKATVLLAVGPNGSVFIRKIAVMNAEKEFDEYLATLTMKE